MRMAASVRARRTYAEGQVPAQASLVNAGGGDPHRCLTPSKMSDTSSSSDRTRLAASWAEHTSYATRMWDVLTWHNGTLSIAWWAVIVLVVAMLSIGGTAAARRK